jgi:tetraacyldisaccharide 4'-kinase
MKWWNRPLIVLALSPFSRLYALAMTVRNRLYDRNVLRSFDIPAAVVSVGNLTVGGTGKTSLVETLADFFQDEGFRPAVVSRGYGRKGKGVVIVSDGKKVLSDPDRTGDEPLLLARHLKGVPVLVGSDRVKAARRAVRSFGSDLILLDDGFQHRRLKRNADVVTLNRNAPFGNGRVLPAGPLREPCGGLRRAHAVVLTGRGEETDVSKKMSPNSYLLHAFYRPVEWVRFSDGRTYPLPHLLQRFVFVFSGIGNPSSFEATLDEIGLKRVDHRVFRDHHRYTADDLKRISECAEAHGAMSIVTTEKDAVRIPHQWRGKLSLYYLRIKIEIKGGRNPLRKVFGPLIGSASNAQFKLNVKNKGDSNSGF